MVALKTLCKQNEIPFLCARYLNMEFLLSKVQFDSHCALGTEIPIKSPIHYFASVTQFEGRVLPLFDFDAYLKDAFGAKAVSSREFLLVSSLQTMSEWGRESLASLNIRYCGNNERLEYIGIKLTGADEIVAIEGGDVKILPPRSYEVQKKRGILGLRFLEDEKIQYILDMEIILINSVVNHNCVGD